MPVKSPESGARVESANSRARASTVGFGWSRSGGETVRVRRRVVSEDAGVVDVVSGRSVATESVSETVVYEASEAGWPWTGGAGDHAVRLQLTATASRSHPDARAIGAAPIGKGSVEMEWGANKNDTYLELPVRTRVNPVAVWRSGDGWGRHETGRNER
jgi:hypothetical protein